MRDNLPFDDFVKQQFSSYSSDVPGHIWENIVAKRKSKPKGFWVSMLNGSNLLLLTLVLIIGGGASYYLFSPPGTGSLTKNIAPQKAIPGAQNINSTPGKNEVENKPSLPADPSKGEGKNNNNNVTGKPENSYDTANHNNLFTPSTHAYKIKNAEVFNSDKGETNKDEKVSMVTAVTQKNNEIPAGKLSSPFRINNARELTTNNIGNKANIKLPDCPTLEKNASGNKTYWEVYTGPDHAFESYKSYGDTASANYLQKRKASTQFSSAFSAGVRYTKVFNNSTSIRAGLNYTQVNEKFLYFNPSEIKYVTVITTRVVIRAPGDTLYFSDTLQFQQTGTRIKSTYNRYRNIDVPLVIGYELGNGRIHANINAGVIINLYSWYKGDVLDSLYQPVNITTGKSNSVYQFKNNIGVGFLGSISVYYKITDKLHLLLEPYFRYNLSPMSKANLNLQQKYNIAGLRAGLRFDLK